MTQRPPIAAINSSMVNRREAARGRGRGEAPRWLGIGYVEEMRSYLSCADGDFGDNVFVDAAVPPDPCSGHVKPAVTLSADFAIHLLYVSQLTW